MDKRLENLINLAVANGAGGHMLNMLTRSSQYTGILEAVVKAGNLSKLADELGVSFQAVQQWVTNGYVPMNRIPEIETLYGVPRVDLMNPKYAAVLAAPNFSSNL